MRKIGGLFVTTSCFLIASVAWGAGLPRHCFVLTEMKGNMDADDSVLLSDLPVLMAMY